MEQGLDPMTPLSMWNWCCELLGLLEDLLELIKKLNKG